MKKKSRKAVDKVETVENPNKNEETSEKPAGWSFKECLWCDHVALRPPQIAVGRVLAPYCLIDSPGTYMVVEEGKIKLLCKTCFSLGIRLTAPFTNA